MNTPAAANDLSDEAAVAKMSKSGVSPWVGFGGRKVAKASLGHVRPHEDFVGAAPGMVVLLLDGPKFRQTRGDSARTT